MNNNFNKFFDENEDIIIETKEDIDAVQQLSDDSVYELALYKSFISDLPLDKQNNRKYQEKYLKLAQNIIQLKNKSLTRLNQGLDSYPELNNVLEKKFNSQWIFPIVLDRKKIFKKIANNDEDLPEVNNKGIILEDFEEDLKKWVDYKEQFSRNLMSFKKYSKLSFDLRQPYVIKNELKKKEIGYSFYLQQMTNFLRFFGVDSKNWEERNGLGPDILYFDVEDEDNKFIRKSKFQLNEGENVNLIGFLILGSSQNSLLDVLEGSPYFNRIREIGISKKIKKNENTIIELPNHGLSDNEKIMITQSNCEPNIDGEYLKGVKVINENSFMIPVETVKDGDFAKIYATSKLNFEKIELNKNVFEGKFETKYDEKAKLYLFPEVELNDGDYETICQKILPSISQIVNSQMTSLENCQTIDDIDKVINKFSLEFKELPFEEYFSLTEILEDQNQKIKPLDYQKFYQSILNSKKELKINDNVKNDIIFGNKYILDDFVKKYYGEYPNIGSEVDSIPSRYNWVIKHVDNGHFYFLFVESKKLKEMSDYQFDKKELETRKNEIKKEIKEIDNTKFTSNKTCENRKVNPVKIYKSFEELYKDNTKESLFLRGDFAVIESSDPNENGQIYEWNGLNWYQRPLIKSIDDLCLLGTDKLQDFDLQKLECLFKEACLNKKEVRAKIKKEKLEKELELLETFGTEDLKELEKKYQENLNIAELNLQIVYRQNLQKPILEDIKVNKNEIDELYQKILKIPSFQNREYLRNLLIKKDGLLIGKDIYSIRTGKKICCGHYLYELKIREGGSPEYSTKVLDEMLAIFGTNREDGIIYCNNDGAPLDLFEYDTSEGLSKVTGEVRHIRSEFQSEEEYLKQKITESGLLEEQEEDSFDCNDPSFRSELMQLGFETSKIVQAKFICEKLNTFNKKTAIPLKKKEFILATVDILQKMQQLPSLQAFAQIEVKKLKSQKVDTSKINKSLISERYNNIMTIHKISLIAARLLITYQNLIPQKYPLSKISGTSFESFDDDKGLEYMALLTQELKIMPIKTKKAGQVSTTYLKLGSIKDEIKKAYEKLSELPNVKKLKRDKKIYEDKLVLFEEKKDEMIVKKVPQVSELPKNFVHDLEKSKKIEQIDGLKKHLDGRRNFLIQEIIDTINDIILREPADIFDPKQSKIQDCCYEKISKDTNYYSFIKAKTDKNIDAMIEELNNIQFYQPFFKNNGQVLKKYLPMNKKFDYSLLNLGVNDDDFRKKLFLAYIDTGFFKGQRHEYNEQGICLLTNENKQDILRKNYTKEDEDNLIKSIVKKSLRKIVLGGNKEYDEQIKKYQEELIDGLDLIKLADEAGKQKSLESEISNFVEKLMVLLNKKGDENYKNIFKLNLQNLGDLHHVYETKTEIITKDMINLKGNFCDRYYFGQDFSHAREILKHKDNRYRIITGNLRKYINQYFRKYISMISNQYDPTEHISEIEDVDHDTSRELQGFIYYQNNFLKPYMSKKYADIFKKLKFSLSAKQVDNIMSDHDLYSIEQDKPEVPKEFNICNIMEILLYVLVSDLDKFISMDLGGKENSVLVAQFIRDVLEKIFKETSKMDVLDDMRFAFGEKKTDDDSKDELPKELKTYDYQLSKLKGKTGSSEKDDVRRETFKEDYKKKFGEDATDNQIEDYLAEKSYEDMVQKDIDMEEGYRFAQASESNQDNLDVGDGYGELPQGIEDE